MLGIRSYLKFSLFTKILAGIYLHIPFCKQACYYCDFHFSTNLSRKSDMVEALCKELLLQQSYLGQETISSIYFGGGTPSLLSEPELKKLLATIDKHYHVAPNSEITLEANPDDLDEKALRQMYESGINRLSIGIQTFDEQQLRFLNRAHNARQAKNCVALAQGVGFDNISIDLIYGIPSPDHTIWKQDLSIALTLAPQHISSYCLTIESSTVFGKWTSKGKMAPIEEEYAAAQFEILVETLSGAGYEQYEISNFCLPEFYSRHNSNYWKQEKYLGIGPGAHSYNHFSRQYNIANNALYLKALSKGEVPFTIDNLDQKAKANEYMMTSLRTKWGCDLNHLKAQYGLDLYHTQKQYLQKMIDENLVTLSENVIRLTNNGKLLADQITEDLFVE